ncbi:hypothetical protein [Pseudomonas sp. MF4836]|uniref:hypothetical protein n=1 Tax=Pseudomonas sp. MF4836 TaxID=1960827 RepID=UPI0009984AB2|nr:hypothetical protein [Pseudomonas sp. MF4836]OOW00516.1 hypothetical protein MF4836_00980 [Pseudomonas sp. MF4836]
MMVLLDKASGLAVNPAEVGSMRYEKWNGSTHLVLTMQNGKELSVQHWPYGDGPNVYRLHEQLLEAQ